jgi:uncharacterized membrane protein
MSNQPAALVPPTRPAVAAPRLESVDLLRGLIMVVMALDHVRDFFHFSALQGINPLDLDRTTAPIFLTRWITHFCAPIFSFLAGTGACFALARGKPKRDLSWFLVTRGLWLIFLELTLFMWFGWTFEVTVHSYVLATLWSLGWSMICLAALLHLPVRVVGWGGVALILVHNAFDQVQPQSWGAWAWLWQVLHAGGNFTTAGGFHFWAFYPLLPWLGVMAAGYAFGTIYQREPAVRSRQLTMLGWGLIAAFVLLRLSNLYGDPQHWAVQGRPLFSLLSFLDCAKYPPSLLYLLMTLGPACLLLARFERGTPRFLRPLLVYGRVPMFYYVLHIPLIHALAWVWATVRFGRADFFLGLGSPAPAGAGLGLIAVYAIWATVVIALYPACRWFADLKRRRRDAWLSYF